MATEYVEKDSPRQASAMQNASPFETDETTFSAPLAKKKNVDLSRHQYGQISGKGGTYDLPGMKR